jgi:hypothetical protein
MATIELTKTELVVRIHGWNVVYAMRRSLRIPLAYVRGVRARPAEADFDHAIIEGWRGIGTYMPRKRAAGLLHLRNGPSFLEVREPEHAIAIDVHRVPVWGYHVNHLVLQVDRETPELAVSRIARAMDRFHGGPSDRATLPELIPVPESLGVAAELVANGASAALHRW